MRPFLVSIPVFGRSFGLPTYGLLLALAFLAALALARKRAAQASLPAEAVLDLWIAALVSGILGAKLLLYAIDYRYYIDNPRAILAGLQSAGVFYGGFVAAVITCLVLVARRGLPGWKIADAAAPAVALGQAIGRLGCFAAGCCFGRPSDLPWAVTFTDPEAHRLTGVPLDIPLHPSQIYESILDLVLFGVLILLSRRRRADGQLFLWYLLLYALLRGAVEFTRGDPRGDAFGASTSQIIAVAAALVAGFFLWTRRRPRPTGRSA
ncbi:MAG: prolipoprotein diacylglyceryl transferase [Acidobacteria bacterium]|nr:prolipoprotein diacylglyceryl transferase [Acidobacteriota bacterium]